MRTAANQSYINEYKLEIETLCVDFGKQRNYYYDEIGRLFHEHWYIISTKVT